ncbi:hypothetical protein C2W62_49405, partial [Candidatus Entotheonella serta]
LSHACGITSTDSAETQLNKVSWLLRSVGMNPANEAPYLLHLWARQGEATPLVKLPPNVIKDRLFATLRQLCARGCQRRPLVLEVEDLHWIDPSSEALMTSLVDQLAHLPILLLITYRPDYLPPWNDRSHTRQMTLSRLSPEDSQRVVQAALPNSQNAVAIIQGIVSKAEGNPFFLEELSRSVEEQGHAVPLAVPDTAHAVLMARLDRLSP